MNKLKRIKILSNYNFKHYTFRFVGRILDVCLYVYASMQKQGSCICINEYYPITFFFLVNSFLEKGHEIFKNVVQLTIVNTQFTVSTRALISL